MTTDAIRRTHDGIVGAVITGGTALGFYVDPVWLLVPGVLGLVLMQSSLTGFCPLYFVLNRACGADGSCGRTATPTG